MSDAKFSRLSDLSLKWGDKTIDFSDITRDEGPFAVTVEIYDNENGDNQVTYLNGDDLTLLRDWLTQVLSREHVAPILPPYEG